MVTIFQQCKAWSLKQLRRVMDWFFWPNLPENFQRIALWEQNHLRLSDRSKSINSHHSHHSHHSNNSHHHWKLCTLQKVTNNVFLHFRTEFSSAAFRFGHSLVRETFVERKHNTHVKVHDMFDAFKTTSRFGQCLQIFFFSYYHRLNNK